MPTLRGLLIVLVVFLFLVASIGLHAQGGTLILQEWYRSKQSGWLAELWTLRTSSGVTKTPTVARSPKGLRFLGPFSNNDTLLIELSNLPRHTRLKVQCGWHIIGPWQGLQAFDRFVASIDRTPIIDATFSNTAYYQSWPSYPISRSLPPRTSSLNSNMLGYTSTLDGGYTGYMDATYETTTEIEHDAGTGLINITAVLPSPTVDTSQKLWGVDHIVITVLDSQTESEFPVRPIQKRGPDLSALHHGDLRELAEFSQDDDFPNLGSSAPLSRNLHITFLTSECHQCGDACLMYEYRLYTDGWLSVWSNRSAKGVSTLSFPLDELEFKSLSETLNECATQPLTKEYRDSAYEDSHPDITHCDLRLLVDGREQRTEVYAGEPPAVTRLLAGILAVLERRGWVPIPR